MLEETERVFCGDGALTLDATLARFDSAAATMRLAIPGEQWRWGSLAYMPGTLTENFDRSISFARNQLLTGIPELHDAWAGAGLFNGCAGFVPESGDGLVISEIHYNPLPGAAGGVAIDGDLYEYVELHNTTTEPINLSGFSFRSGIEYRFDINDVIAPDGYFTLASDATRFGERYGAAPDATYSGRLDNGGETLTLIDAVGGDVDQVIWHDQDPWPTQADGEGPSLTLVDSLSDNALAESWELSGTSGGTPGAENETFLRGDVDCSGDLSIVDALLIAQFAVGNRSDAQCPLDDLATELNARAGDLNLDQRTSIVDALLIAQCVVGIDNGWCPPME